MFLLWSKYSLTIWVGGAGFFVSDSEQKKGRNGSEVVVVVIFC